MALEHGVAIIILTHQDFWNTEDIVLTRRYASAQGLDGFIDQDGEPYMKQRFGTVIDADILRLAKRQAADEGRPLSDLIQDALDHYLLVGMPAPSRREAAYSLFCEQPMRITPEQFREVLQADAWDT